MFLTSFDSAAFLFYSWKKMHFSCVLFSFVQHLLSGLLPSPPPPPLFLLLRASKSLKIHWNITHYIFMQSFPCRTSSYGLHSAIPSLCVSESHWTNSCSWKSQTLKYVSKPGSIQSEWWREINNPMPLPPQVQVCQDWHLMVVLSIQKQQTVICTQLNKLFPGSSIQIHWFKTILHSKTLIYTNTFIQIHWFKTILHSKILIYTNTYICVMVIFAQW